MEELGLDKLPPIKLSYNTSEAHAAIAQAVQDMWKENLGAEVELNNEEWAVYLDSWGLETSRLVVWVGLLTLTMQSTSLKFSNQLVEITTQSGRVPNIKTAETIKSRNGSRST